jgi:hypothetical protein
VDLLRVLSQHIVSQPVSAVLPNLPHHLKLLVQAMRKSTINPSVSSHHPLSLNPRLLTSRFFWFAIFVLDILWLFFTQSTVQFLNQILHVSEISIQGNWSLGNCILAVCHSILLHHDTRQVVRGKTTISLPSPPLQISLVLVLYCSCCVIEVLEQISYYCGKLTVQTDRIVMVSCPSILIGWAVLSRYMIGWAHHLNSVTAPYRYTLILNVFYVTCIDGTPWRTS